jgi:hypothetical protein
MYKKMRGGLWIYLIAAHVCVFWGGCTSIIGQSVSRNDSYRQLSFRSFDQRVVPDHIPASYGWEDGMTSLILQVLYPLPANDVLKVAVADFREVKTGEKPALGNALESSVRSSLAKIESVEVTGERADRIPQYSLSGLYHLEPSGLRINATLYEVPSGRIVSWGRVTIHPDDPRVKTFSQSVATAEPRSSSTDTHITEDYQFLVNSLVFTQPENSGHLIEVWTDKKIYQIGDKVTFYFRADHDSYVNLIDVGSSGQVSVLFPNRHHPDNFVKANRIYTIPEEDSGFSIFVQGPPGLERIKAIATQQPLPLDITSPDQAFNALSKDGDRKTDGLLMFVKKLEKQPWSIGYTEIYIRGDGVVFPPPGDLRTIRPQKPEKPIDIIGVPGRKPDEPMTKDGSTLSSKTPTKDQDQ